MHRLVLGSLLITLTASTTACSDDETAHVGDGDGGSGGSAVGGSGGSASGDCTTEGTTQCDGLLVQTCQADGGALSWSTSTECPGEQSCRQDACSDPTPEQLAQADTSAAYVDLLVARSAWHQPIDADALKQDSRQQIIEGDGSDLSYFTAMRGIHLGVPQGHQSLYGQACDAPDMAVQGWSRFGVCARPHGDGMVVTHAVAGNSLGLQAGDRVVRAGDDAGVAMLEAAARRPICGTSSPTDASRLGLAASTFFGNVPVGTELDIEPVGGAAFSMMIPEESDDFLTSCQDPLGRDIEFNASSYLRPDGVAVVRVPRFFPLNGVVPTDPNELNAWIAAFQQEIVDAFDQVKAAPALIWDMRSNFGGISLVGLAIAGGMPTAQATQLTYCEARIPNSDPPAFDNFKYAEYEVVPGGPFAYSGDVAVLIDELDYSAADYFPLAVATATQSLLVGTPTAGAYGGGSGATELVGSNPATFVSIDVNRCSDVDGAPLEGRSVMPDLTVEYDPDDLAAGVDTVMEAAAAALLAP